MKNLFIGGLIIAIIHFLVSLIGLQIAGYTDQVRIPQRVWVNGEFKPFGIFLTPLQVEGTKNTTISDSIAVTQNYVWGQDFKKVSMVAGEEAKTKQWSDSLVKGFSPNHATVKYFYGEGDLAREAHGKTLEELLKGKTFTAMAVTGFASPEAGEPSSLLRGCVDPKNVVLAKERASMTVVILKRLFRSNGKNISNIKTTLAGVEAQLPEAIANGLATEQGFKAVIASNRASKDTLGFKAFTELSKRRFTSVKLNYTEQKSETMVITQLFLLPLLLLWLLWNLLTRIKTPRIGTPKLPRWSCRFPQISCGPWSWPSCRNWNCNFNWCKWPSCGSLPKINCSPCDWSWLCIPCCVCTCTPPPPQDNGPCCCYRRMRNGKKRWRLCFAIKRLLIPLRRWWAKQECTCCWWKFLLLASNLLWWYFYVHKCI